MRTAVSVLLATALVTTPIKLVLAQTAQQEAATVQQTAPPDSSGHRLIGVPPVTDNTSRLWINPSDHALLNTEFVDALLVQGDNAWWDGLSTAEKIFFFLGLIVVAGATVGGIRAAGENDDPESFKSSHSVVEGIGLGAVYAVTATAVLLAIAGLANLLGCAGSCF